MSFESIQMDGSSLQLRADSGFNSPLIDFRGIVLVYDGSIDGSRSLMTWSSMAIGVSFMSEDISCSSGSEISFGMYSGKKDKYKWWSEIVRMRSLAHSMCLLCGFHCPRTASHDHPLPRETQLSGKSPVQAGNCDRLRPTISCELSSLLSSPLLELRITNNCLTSGWLHSSLVSWFRWKELLHLVDGRREQFDVGYVRGAFGSWPPSDGIRLSRPKPDHK